MLHQTPPDEDIHTHTSYRNKQLNRLQHQKTTSLSSRQEFKSGSKHLKFQYLSFSQTIHTTFHKTSSCKQKTAAFDAISTAYNTHHWWTLSVKRQKTFTSMFKGQKRRLQQCQEITYPYHEWRGRRHLQPPPRHRREDCDSVRRSLTPAKTIIIMLPLNLHWVKIPCHLSIIIQFHILQYHLKYHLWISTHLEPFQD